MVLVSIKQWKKLRNQEKGVMPPTGFTLVTGETVPPGLSPSLFINEMTLCGLTMPVVYRYVEGLICGKI